MARRSAESDAIDERAARASAAAASPASSSGSATFSSERQRRQQVEELEDEADALAPQPRQRVVVRRSSVTPVEMHGRRRTVHRAAQVQQRGLAAARRPDDRHELAGVDLEADVVDGRHRVGARGNVRVRRSATSSGATYANASRTSRTRETSTVGVNGFCRNATPALTTPRRTIGWSV